MSKTNQTARNAATPAQGIDLLRPGLQRLRQAGFAVGIVALLILIAGAFIDRTQFFQSYINAYLFWFGLPLGMMGVLMIQHLSGGAWGYMVQRLCEAGARTLPLMALLFLPLLFGLQDLYPWARPEAIHDSILVHRAVYNNIPFFILRAVLIFGVWYTLKHYLVRWSYAYDQTGDPAIKSRLRGLSGVGMVLYIVLLTLAATDWGMTLDPHWFSTMYGAIYLIGQVLLTFATLVITLNLLRNNPAMSQIIRSRILDLGTLLFAAVIIWTYINFAQFLITYGGEVVEFTSWYDDRRGGGWPVLIISVVVLQFALPFFILMSRAIKRRVEYLSWVAGLIILMRMVDLFWLIQPTFHPGMFHISWMDLVAYLSMGALWVGSFAWTLSTVPSLLPMKDPRASEAIVPHPHSLDPNQHASTSHVH